MVTLHVKFRQSTASDEMTRNMCRLGLLSGTQFHMVESSPNVARFATVTVPDKDAVRYRREILLLPQVECIEH